MDREASEERSTPYPHLAEIKAEIVKAAAEGTLFPGQTPIPKFDPSSFDPFPKSLGSIVNEPLVGAKNYATRRRIVVNPSARLPESVREVLASVLFAIVFFGLLFYLASKMD